MQRKLPLPNKNIVHKEKDTKYLVSMSTAEAIGNRFRVEIELLITSLPLVVLVLSHQTLNTVDKREMIALQKKKCNDLTLTTLHQTKRSQSNLIILLTNLGHASIAQASTVSKRHSNAPCCNKLATMFNVISLQACMITKRDLRYKQHLK